ncbi:GNAT family N-acetyltransferase [Patescibacteria group bacterium]|nr:GNAT family N-acetyltransferase [Patescibacteria group bacterium]MCL5410154.1 GNAT family N-acetyltransferase [Patescibacteria group bacterium]
MTDQEAEVRVRNYLLEDYPQVRSIYDEADMFYEPFDTEDKFVAKIHRDPESIMVAVKSNQVVGTVMIVEDGRMSMIFRLAVIERERKQGIGPKLLQEAERRLKDRGHNEVHILVDQNNEELQDYYARLGYEKTSYYYRWQTKVL